MAEINNETREALGEFMKGLSEEELDKAIGGLSKKQKGLLFSALGLVALAGGGYGLYKHYHPGQSEGGGNPPAQPPAAQPPAEGDAIPPVAGGAKPETKPKKKHRRSADDMMLEEAAKYLGH